MQRYLVVCGLSIVAACVDQMPPAESSVEQATFVCGVGPTVKGIDVSKYEPTIDWPAVAADGVEFAFVRVSDGTMFPDELFDSHWAGSHAAGIKHGAYQFFRPTEDPIVQADMLLAKIGNSLAADDLPPVIDLEASDDEPAATIASKIQAWIDHVTASIGRGPIVYTNRPFWRDVVGDLDLSAHPLWHAQYTTAPCPNIATPWPTWHVWQFTETGTVSGIMHDVDINRWNGTRASLDAFLGPKGSSASTCGDAACTVGEDASSCPQDCPRCGTVGPEGGVIDDGDACFEQGGPPQFMRHVSTTGEGGDLVWTKASNRPATIGDVNYGMWHLFLEDAGRYQVDVFTEADVAQSKQAKYVVQAGGASMEVAIDQTGADGWQTLGAFDFAAGGYQSVFLGDDTGELPSDNVQIVFDAVRLTRVAGDAATDDGNSNGDAREPGGCAVGGNQLGLVLVGLLATCLRACARACGRRRGTRHRYAGRAP